MMSQSERKDVAGLLVLSFHLHNVSPVEEAARFGNLKNDPLTASVAGPSGSVLGFASPPLGCSLRAILGHSSGPLR
jgi:hypothetical protein